jgi:hypothetical protein
MAIDTFARRLWKPTNGVIERQKSAMRRAPQLGQKPRRLQLKASNFSSWQDSHLTLRKP